VDSKNDMAIDAILVEEPINEYFEIHPEAVKKNLQFILSVNNQYKLTEENSSD